MTATPKGRDSLEALDRLARANQLDFPVFFRHRSLAMKCLYTAGRLRTEAAAAVPTEFVADEDLQALVSKSKDSIRASMPQILMSQHSADILWLLYCCPSDGGHSALLDLVPSLGRISDVVRGGPNLYKLSGWVVHVLLGYTVVTRCIPEGVPPSTRKWTAGVRRYFARDLLKTFSSLDASARLVLRTAMLGHDIGVAVDITDHDQHGVPLVRRYLKEIGLDATSLAAHGFASDFEDAAWAIESVVRHHTLVNRIGVEFSKSRSRAEVAGLLDSATSSAWRASFVHDSLASVLLLVGTADLIAVDDALLDELKIAQIRRGHAVLASILAKEDADGDVSQQGFQRYLNFVNQEASLVSKESLDAAVTSLGLNPQEIWQKIYHVQELNFALSLLPYLPGSDSTLMVFLVLFHFVDTCIGDTVAAYQSTRVVFSDALEPETVLPLVSRVRTAGKVDGCVSAIAANQARVENIIMEAIEEEGGHAVTVRAEGASHD
jgi:hypothetical protein